MSDPLADLCDPLLRSRAKNIIKYALQSNMQLETELKQIRSSPKHA